MEGRSLLQGFDFARKKKLRLIYRSGANVTANERIDVRQPVESFFAEGSVYRDEEAMEYPAFHGRG